MPEGALGRQITMGKDALRRRFCQGNNRFLGKQQTSGCSPGPLSRSNVLNAWIQAIFTVNMLGMRTPSSVRFSAQRDFAALCRKSVADYGRDEANTSLFPRREWCPEALYEHKISCRAESVVSEGQVTEQRAAQQGFERFENPKKELK